MPWPNSGINKVQFKSKIFQRSTDLFANYVVVVSSPVAVTLRHAETTTICFYVEQELHSYEMFYKACVPQSDIFW